MLGLLTGCGTPADRRLEPLSLQVTELSGDDASLTLRLANVNTVPLVVRDSTHTVQLGEKRLGRVEDQEPIGVPALGAITHRVALPKALAQRVRSHVEANPGEVRVSVSSTFEILLTGEETLIMKSSGSDWVKPR